MTVRISWKRVLLALLALSVLVMGFAWSGIVNLAANVPHFQPVEWFIHWTYENSVRTQARKVAEPAIDATGLVSAAGHFATSCASCHGAPGERPSPVMQAAAVKAPDLAVNAKNWSNRELFWIIKHGVKYTPMPAWPTQDRDDEVRRMVAFVRLLPGMSPVRYRALAHGPASATQPQCAGCHGADGLGRGQRDIPVIAGQNQAAIIAALDKYANRERPSAVMQTVAARTDPTTWRGIAANYAALPGRRVHDPTTIDTARDRAAAEIVARGLPSVGLPACSSCHARGKREYHPILRGQKPDYLAARLRRWQEGDAIEANRSAATMPTIARRIPADMIDPLARYYAIQR